MKRKTHVFGVVSGDKPSHDFMYIVFGGRQMSLFSKKVKAIVKADLFFMFACIFKEERGVGKEREGGFGVVFGWEEV